ncbi:MAG: hypothetical protein BWY78_01500 [Alphaproteobacteria bacterium ADurb.Bin438]|nr:MAG: hypothetical protein BWY78_01500 [Alphaproteobacteria bacterium ADurb.Bin438]
MEEKKEQNISNEKEEVITKSMVITSSVVFLTVLNVFLLIATHFLNSAIIKNNFVLINFIMSTFWVLAGKFEHLLIKLATTLVFFGIISGFIVIIHIIN